MKHTPILLTVLLPALLVVRSASAQGSDQAKPARPAAQKAAQVLPVPPQPTLANVPYGTQERQVLDFWKAESSTPTPLVFVIHGGGWSGGEKERVNRFVDVDELLKAGISVVSINYRFIKHAEADGVKPPVKGPLHDAARALAVCPQQGRRVEHRQAADRRVRWLGGSVFEPVAGLSRRSGPSRRAAIPSPASRRGCGVPRSSAQTTLDPQQMQAWTPNSNYGGHAFGSGLPAVPGRPPQLPAEQRVDSQRHLPQRPAAFPNPAPLPHPDEPSHGPRQLPVTA